MTKENYQNDSYNFDNLVKSIIQKSGIEINLDSDFVLIKQEQPQLSRQNHKVRRFKKFIEMRKKRKNKLALSDDNQQKKEELKEELKDDLKDDLKEELKDDLKDDLPLTLSLIHSIVDINKNNNKYYKQFQIPLNILLGLKNNRGVEYAINNIILEKDCHYGLYCPYKSNPLKCPYNHHEIKYKLIDNCKVIIKGEQIPNLLCLYERPWRFYKNTLQPMRCTNPFCWYNHANGREKLITNNGYYKYAF
jgi:hypothetical protein